MKDVYYGLFSLILSLFIVNFFKFFIYFKSFLVTKFKTIESDSFETHFIPYALRNFFIDYFLCLCFYSVCCALIFFLTDLNNDLDALAKFMHNRDISLEIFDAEILNMHLGFSLSYFVFFLLHLEIFYYCLFLRFFLNRKLSFAINILAFLFAVYSLDILILILSIVNVIFRISDQKEVL